MCRLSRALSDLRHTTVRALKAGPAADRLLSSMLASEFDSPLTQRLESRFRHYVATSATAQTLSSGSRRLAEFLAFARELFGYKAGTSLTPSH